MPEDRSVPAAPAVVTWTGEIDLSSIEGFRTAIREAEEAGGDLTIDLRRSTFIDSTGVSALVGAGTAAHGRGAQVTVLVELTMMRRVFWMMNLDTLLTIEPPLSSADGPGDSAHARD